MKKELGQIFTSYKIIDKLLEEIEYNCSEILHKFVLEPSFGDGRILLSIIETYILEAKKMNYSLLEISEHLSTYIYGIEIDETLFTFTENKIKELYKKYNLNYKSIHIIHANSLLWNTSLHFDYIIGNPPYMNLKKEEYDLYNKYKFSNKISNLYLLFFEFGFSHLNKYGKLIYITPNSYFKTKSQENLRNDWITNRKITKIIDYNQELLFQDAQTYTCITLLTNKRNESFQFESQNYSITFSYNNDIDLFLNKLWIFKSKHEIEHFNKGIPLENLVSIQMGCVCGKESIYIIHKYSEDNDYIYFIKNNTNYKIEKVFLKNCVKISKYKDDKFSKIIFPYFLNENNKYEIIKEDVLKNKCPFLYNYLLNYKNVLERRYLLKDMLWYEFTKNQAFYSIGLEKLIMSKYLLNKDSSIVSYIIPKDTLVYSGICITSNGMPLETLQKEFKSKNFFDYCKLYGKDISQAKELSSKLVKKYKLKEDI